VLIDEARTPLIISGAGDKSTQIYNRCDIIAKSLVKGEREGEVNKMTAIMGEEVKETGDFIVNEKEKHVVLTEEGVAKVEKALGIENLADADNLEYQHCMNLALRANYLMFKDKDSSYINSMSTRGIVRENQLEVFPFILKVDRYTLALNGIQGFDQRFKYHVSAIKSPIPFRFGVNLGGTFDSWKWKLGKARFKSTKVPLFDNEIDEVRLNLVNSIHNIFSRGVEHAIMQQEKAQEAVQEKKAETAYSVEETEELSELERKALETLGKISEE
jgi:preprotein translocase subunit SecA